MNDVDAVIGVETAVGTVAGIDGIFLKASRLSGKNTATERQKR